MGIVKNVNKKKIIFFKMENAKSVSLKIMASASKKKVI